MFCVTSGEINVQFKINRLSGATKLFIMMFKIAQLVKFESAFTENSNIQIIVNGLFMTDHVFRINYLSEC